MVFLCVLILLRRHSSRSDVHLNFPLEELLRVLQPWCIQDTWEVLKLDGKMRCTLLFPSPGSANSKPAARVLTELFFGSLKSLKHVEQCQRNMVTSPVRRPPALGSEFWRPKTAFVSNRPPLSDTSTNQPIRAQQETMQSGCTPSHRVTSSSVNAFVLNNVINKELLVGAVDVSVPARIFYFCADCFFL